MESSDDDEATESIEIEGEENSDDKESKSSDDSAIKVGSGNDDFEDETYEQPEEADDNDWDETLEEYWPESLDNKLL